VTMKRLLVMPARNEEANIVGVLEAVHRECPAYDVVIVNDGSKDRTAQLARRNGATVLTLPCHLGYGGAIQTGLKYALLHGYGRVALMDADGQHDPKELSRLEAVLEERGADMVIGSRFLTDTGYQMPLARRMGSRWFAFLTSVLIGQRMTDTTSGFQVMGERAIRLMAEEYPVDSPHAEMLVLAGRMGLKLAEASVPMYERLAGESMYNFLSSVYYPFKMTLAALVAVLRAVLLQKEANSP